MIDTLNDVVWLILAIVGVGLTAALIWDIRANRGHDDTYIDPTPEPPDWVNDAHHHRRPRRGGWRQDCTSE